MASAASVWKDPQCAFRIEWEPDKLDQVHIAVTDALYALPRGGVEVGGLLLGNFDGKLLRVADWAAMECEHLTGPSFVLSAKDEAALEAQLMGMSGRAVGWFHSHTRSDIVFSPADLTVHQRFFPQPWQVAMVLRPAHMQPLRANYFFRNGGGVMMPAASEFVVGGRVEPGNRAPRAEPAEPRLHPAAQMPEANRAKPVIPVVEKPVRKRAAKSPEKPVEISMTPLGPNQEFKAAPPVAEPEATRIPPSLSGPSERKGKPNYWLLGGLLALSGLGSAAYFTQDLWMPAPPEPLKLQATDVEGKLLIRWTPIRNAQSGQLHISDGDRNIDVALEATQLSQGYYLFPRKAMNDTVRLTVGSRQDTTSFAGPLPVQKDER